MSMRLENGFILEQVPGQFHGFSDGFHRNFAAPGPDNAFPRRTESDLLQDLEDHNPRSLKCRFPVTDLRIGDDVFAEFEAFGFAVRSGLHIAALEFRLAERGLQAVVKTRSAAPEKTVNGQNAVRNLIAATRQSYRLSQ